MFRSYEFKGASTNDTSVDEDGDDSQVDESCGDENPLHDPMSALLAMFIMSLNKFDETVCHFERTDHPTLTVVNMTKIKQLNLI
jgi:hypothetical protein